jgi:putative intracellular protease/amidase
MRTILLFFVLLIGITAAPALRASPPDKVLLVVSSHGRDQGRARPGFEMDEYAQAWATFRDNGFALDVASPAGGVVEPDRFDVEKPYNQHVLDDAEAMGALTATLRTAEIDPRDYAAVFVLGGGGAMFDLYADPALRTLLARIYEAGGVVGAVCHGPAVLSEVRLSGGEWLVTGRRVTGFTNAEEALFGRRWSASYPVLLETAMLERGARFAQGAEMLPFVAADGRLVTGQNPFSTALAAEAMIRAIGRAPAPRQA